MSEESHYKVLRIQKEGNYSLAFKLKKTFPHDFLIFSSLGHTTKVLFFKGNLLVHHPERQPKNVCKRARGSADDHFPIYHAQMQDSHHRFDRISKETDLTLSIHSQCTVCVHLKQRSVLLFALSFNCRKFCFR